MPLNLRSGRLRSKEMNLVVVPGFTAERSPDRSRKRYRAAVSNASDSQVTLAAFNITCYLVHYFRTYDRCRSIGYGEDACAGVADDVAGFACR